ncbi:hypothetical protein ILYODFUR_034310 [Ilyodon furcidens]|uniref:Uncharacterized protein n=1 Tax=Ilyodon furcidens TaxID=33524 RepID=A0ABV0VJF7_9TELE
MQHPSASLEAPVLTAHPKHQSQLPVHLRNYAVQPVGWRQPEQRYEHTTANSASRMSPHSSRAISPVIQYAEHITLDEWNVSEECQAVAESLLNHRPQQYFAPPATVMAAPSSSSPFYRPWEEPASCGVIVILDHHY